MREYIRISEELREEIREKFFADRVSIWRACHYLSNSERAKEMRSYALANGGRVVREVYIPACTCQESNDMMVQDFGNGVRLEIDLNRNTAIILQGEYIHQSFDGLTLRGWCNACMLAQSIAESPNLAAQRA